MPRPRRLRCALDSRCGDSHCGFAVFEVEWDDAEAMAASLSSRGTGSRNGNGSLRQ
jgi:hypothetical protein